MAEEILASVQVRRDNKANWEAVNPILLDGEAAYEKDTDMFKIGDGVNKYKDLPYHNKVGPKGDTGSSGVYIGTSQPTDSNINVWIDSDGEPTEVIDNLAREEISSLKNDISALNEANAQQDTEIAKKANDADLAAVAKSGSYNDLTNKPTIPSAYTLPTASASVLGGVKPVAKTDEMTQAVGVDAQGGLWALPGGEKDWTKICGGNITEEVASITIDANADGTPISNLDINEMVIIGKIYLTGNGNVRFEFNGLWTSGNYFAHEKLGAWSHAFIIHIVRYLDRWCVEYNGGSSSAVITPAVAFRSFEIHSATDGVLFGTGTNLNVYYR